MEYIDTKTVFDRCLNVLRDNEALTGEKALRNMSYLLVLKLIEPHLGKEIDIENYEYDFSIYDDDVIEENKKRLFSILRFSNLSKEKEEAIPNLMKDAWSIILSKHPSTKTIFVEDKCFDFQHQSTYKKLIDNLNALDLSNTDYTVYEDMLLRALAL
jgi:hypothetical protein